MTSGRALRLGLCIAALVAIVDQLTKWWILAVVMQPPRPITITPFFNIVLGWNRGVSFGLFDSASPANAWVLSGLACAIVVGLLIWLYRAPKGLPAIAIGLIVGGAIGNVIDRLRFGAVTDFLDFHAFGWHWPAFNAADTGISVGAAILVIDSLFGEQETPKNKAPTDNTAEK